MTTSTGTLILLSIAIAALSACGGSSSDDSLLGSSSSASSSTDDRSGGGPCVHYYYDQVLNIDRVIGNPSNTELDSVSLVEVMQEGDAAVELEEWCTMQPEGLCYGLSFEDETTTCSPPCGFGHSEGEWRIRLSAEGYQPSTVTLDASYDVFEGGCPSYNDEGAHFELELNANEG